jgi:hypothetical protein
MKPFCPMIFNYFQIFGHLTTYHQILSHSKTTRCANMTKFMFMTKHKNHIMIICKKRIRTQFFITECLIIAKSKTPIQLCMFYNQQTLRLNGCLVVGPCLVMGFSTLISSGWAFFLVLDSSLLIFFFILNGILM